MVQSLVGRVWEYRVSPLVPSSGKSKWRWCTSPHRQARGQDLTDSGVTHWIPLSGPERPGVKL